MPATPTVGILHCGEMGSAIGSLLVSLGVRTITSLEGRSPATIKRCREAGIVERGALENVIRESDVLLALTPPDAARELAASCARLAHLAPPQAIYVDCNSIAPEEAQAIAALFDRSGRNFVDGAINGLAKNLVTGGTLFLSGAAAPQVAALFGEGMCVRVLDDRPGSASAMKMLLSGLSKGLCALFVETALHARQRGMLDEMTREYSRIYPGVMRIVDRMLPTYARHAHRRAQECRSMEASARAAGIEPCLLTAVRELHERMEMAIDSANGNSRKNDEAEVENGSETNTVQTMIETIATAGASGLPIFVPPVSPPAE